MLLFHIWRTCWPISCNSFQLQSCHFKKSIHPTVAKYSCGWGYSCKKSVRHIELPAVTAVLPVIVRILFPQTSLRQKPLINTARELERNREIKSAINRTIYKGGCIVNISSNCKVEPDKEERPKCAENFSRDACCCVKLVNACVSELLVDCCV